eukprot:1549480-Rhodomonas_salina.1
MSSSADESQRRLQRRADHGTFSVVIQGSPSSSSSPSLSSMSSRRTATWAAAFALVTSSLPF